MLNDLTPLLTIVVGIVKAVGTEIIENGKIYLEV